MCGRYTLSVEEPVVLDRFGLTTTELILTPRYNIAPTQPIPVVLNTSPETLSAAKWGLIPAWAKDAKMAATMINARSETLLEKPSFRTILKSQRCLVVADGFYEWKKNEDGTKTPYRVQLDSGEVFAMAGLWDTWKAPDGTLLRTCTIITTTANDVLAPLHERMAVILPPETERLWLEQNTPNTLLDLL
ncbi:MAG TPA: SOS response-associated peptidase, partial [Acidobacteriota bacterium]|nr:SOS response-associated peptidase [Acidobacteriota bacterium]